MKREIYLGRYIGTVHVTDTPMPVKENRKENKMKLEVNDYNNAKDLVIILAFNGYSVSVEEGPYGANRYTIIVKEEGEKYV